ncbi:MAG: hypothetical protein ACRDHG_06215 [Anaerolineales bacterium]
MGEEKTAVVGVTRTALAKVEGGLTPTNLATAFAASGFFPDVRKVSQAIVKIVAGQELGLGPIASVNGIHFIEGALVPGANVMAALVKRSGDYDYKVLELDDEKCTIQFLHKAAGEWEAMQPDVTFTMSDARRASLVKARSGWEKFPKNMLFARALSNGFKWHTPHLGGGFPMYDPSEFGSPIEAEFAEVDYPAADSPIFEGGLAPAEDAEAAAGLGLDAAPQVEGGRVKNQWENDVLTRVLGLGLTENRFSAVATLNQSPFVGVPFGQLAMGEAVAWFVCWQEVKAELGADAETDERGQVARGRWKDPIQRAAYSAAAADLINFVSK